MDFLDPDQEGFVTAPKLQKGLETFGIKLSKRDLFNLMRVLDFDGNGSIDFDELEAAMLNPRTTLMAKGDIFDRLHGTMAYGGLSIAATFAVFAEGREDTVVGAAALQKGLEAVGIKLARGDLSVLMKVFDKDSSGTLDLSEFYDALVRTSRRPGSDPVPSPPTARPRGVRTSARNRPCHLDVQLDPDAVRKFEEEAMVLPQSSAASTGAPALSRCAVRR
jgi:Ca2+-binding EF-hand superfamily protein